jgi:WD40 repeat protein
MSLPNANLFDTEGFALITDSQDINTIMEYIGMTDTREYGCLFVKTGDGDYQRVLGYDGSVPPADLDQTDLWLLLPFPMGDCLALYMELRERAKDVCDENGCDIENDEHLCEDVDIYAYINPGGEIISVCGSDSWTGRVYPYSQISLPTYELELKHFIKDIADGFDNWYEDNGYNE